VGIHSGSVIAGVVGRKMPRYHLFGTTVTTAEALEQTGQPNTVTISDSTYCALGPRSEAFVCVPIQPLILPTHDKRSVGRWEVRQSHNESTAAEQVGYNSHTADIEYSDGGSDESDTNSRNEHADDEDEADSPTLQHVVADVLRVVRSSRVQR